MKKVLGWIGTNVLVPLGVWLFTGLGTVPCVIIGLFIGQVWLTAWLFKPVFTDRLSATIRWSTIVLADLLILGAAGYGGYRYYGTSTVPRVNITWPASSAGTAVDVSSDDLRVSGTVSGLINGRSVWAAIVPADSVTDGNLNDSKIYPAFGPCIVSEHNFVCDHVYLGDPELYYVVVLTVDTRAARALVRYQGKINKCEGMHEAKRKYPTCYDSMTIPRSARIRDTVAVSLIS